MLNEITLVKKKNESHYNSGFLVTLDYILKTVNFVINLWTKLLHVRIHDNPGLYSLYFK